MRYCSSSRRAMVFSVFSTAPSFCSPNVSSGSQSASVSRFSGRTISLSRSSMGSRSNDRVAPKLLRPQYYAMPGTLSGLIAAYGYAGLFFLIGLESLGLPLPGETALVTAAALAGLGHLSIYGVVATAVAAAVLGDNGGYWIGRNGGIALVRRYGRVIHLNESHLERARRFFERHGPKTVFIGRFIALLRTWAAVLAGAARMPYRTFMLYNALGAVCWAVVFGALGYGFGRNLPQLEHYIGQASLAGALLVALVVGLVFGWRWLETSHPRAGTFVATRFARGQYLGLHLTIGLAISLAGLWLFAAITEDVIHHDPLTQFDVMLLEWVHTRATPTGYAVSYAISLLGSPVTLTILGLGVGLLLGPSSVDRARRLARGLRRRRPAGCGAQARDPPPTAPLCRRVPPPLHVELSERPRDGLAHRLRHARLRAHAALDPQPRRANRRGAGRRPAGRGRWVEPTLPRTALFQRCRGWVRRRSVVALGMHLRRRGCAPEGCGTAVGRSLPGVLVQVVRATRFHPLAYLARWPLEVNWHDPLADRAAGRLCQADPGGDRGRIADAPGQDVRVLGPGVAQGNHRGAAARCGGSRDAQPCPAQRRAGERSRPHGARTSGHRRTGRQPCLRSHAREVDGGGRRDGVRQFAQLDDEESDRDA